MCQVIYTAGYTTNGERAPVTLSLEGVESKNRAGDWEFPYHKMVEAICREQFRIDSRAFGRSNRTHIYQYNYVVVPTITRYYDGHSYRDAMFHYAALQAAYMPGQYDLDLIIQGLTDLQADATANPGRSYFLPFLGLGFIEMELDLLDMFLFLPDNVTLYGIPVRRQYYEYIKQAQGDSGDNSSNYSRIFRQYGIGV